MTYARARLWVGITGVGTWVLLSLAGILFQWGTLWESWFPHTYGVALDLALWLLAFTLIQAPLDWLGGFYLPGRFGRARTSFLAWLRGSLAMSALWWLGSMILFASGQRMGILGALLAMAACMLALTVAQQLLARIVGTFTVTGTEQGALLVSSNDPGFSGGWAGLVSPRLLVPSHWPKKARATQVVRRRAVLESGARTRGILLAIVFNLTGLAVSDGFTPGAGFASSGEYLHLVFGYTLWSFLGLLTLPSLTRPAVFLADHLATRQGIAWQEAAQVLDRLQDDEPARAPWIERIFHPIPSLRSRWNPPESPRWGAWQAARLALYLSAPVPGLLARSVHCNAGRPDLWVFYPAD